MVKQTSQAVPSTSKRPYQAPALREFGALHQFTQGSKRNGNDAGSTKGKN